MPTVDFPTPEVPAIITRRGRRPISIRWNRRSMKHATIATRSKGYQRPRRGPTMTAKEQMSIGGEWRDAADGATSLVHDPSDGSVLAHIPMATVDDVDAAVAASRAALHDPAWRHGPLGRGRVLRRIGEVTYSQAKTPGRPRIEEQWEDLCEGSPRSDTGLRPRVLRRSDRQDRGVHDPGPRRPTTPSVSRCVTAHIIPWNFPLQLALQHRTCARKRSDRPGEARFMDTVVPPYGPGDRGG